MPRGACVAPPGDARRVSRARWWAEGEMNAWRARGRYYAGQELAFKRAVETMTREFFSHCSVEEFELQVREAIQAHGGGAGTTEGKCGMEAQVVKRMIASALDRGAREREMCANAMATLRASGTLDSDDFERGFDRVLAEIADIKLDFPDAVDECVVFLARAVADEVVSVTYLETACSRDGYGEGRDAAQKAKWKLEEVGGEARVRQAWGGSEGYSASGVKVQMRDIIDEYLMARDGAEAERRLRRLNVPFYHHELVRTALNLAIVQSVLTPNVVEKVTDLLKYLGRSSFVNGSQMAKGFARTATSLKDISMDVPKAPEVFAELIEGAKRAGLLPTGLSAWASVKTTAFGGKAAQGHKQLLRLDSAPDLAALARATSRSSSASPSGSRSASPAPLLKQMQDMSTGRKPSGLTRMGSATKQINAGWNGLRAHAVQTNLKLGPRAQGFDAKGELSNGLARHQIAHFFHKRIDHKPEGVTKNKLGLKRMFSAPGGLGDLDTSRFVRPVGLVHDYMPFLEKYDLLEEIGSGGFAVVRKAKHRATGDIVAVKTLRVQGMGAESDEEDGDDSSSSSSDEEDGPQTMTLHGVKRELVMMQQLSTHPNIVTIREFFTEQNDEVVHVVMDCLQGEELDDWVNERGAIPEDDVKTLMMSMLDAVAFMHSKGVIHRDLKLENFVFAEKGNLNSLSVVDFGLAKALNARQKAQHVCGTLSYISPEALLAGVYGQGVDVWALGVAMHVLLTNTWPFDDDDDDELYEQIIECDLDFETEAWKGVSEVAKDLIEGLLDSRPKHRLTAAQALEHEWFTGQSSHTSDRLYSMHSRLDSLISISNQPPERRFKDGEYITRQGDPSVEFFIIISGECTLTRDGVVVGVRRVGNFVGELRNLEESADDVVLAAWTSARAVGDVRVLVFHDTELQWVHQHDYRLTYEFESMIRMQRRSIAKQAREQRKRELALKAAEVETGESDKDHSMMRSVSAQPLVGAE